MQLETVPQQMAITYDQNAFVCGKTIRTKGQNKRYNHYHLFLWEYK